MIKELECYCTTSGELVKLVRDKTPMCFVPYTQAKELFDELTSLKKQLTLMPAGDILEMLDNPKEPNDNLKKLLRTK